MIISKRNEQIIQTIQMAENHNLSNIEEQQLTITLCHQLKKMLILTLSKNERIAYKVKRQFIESKTNLNDLIDYIKNQNQSYRYLNNLSFFLNLKLYLSSKATIQGKIFKELMRIFYAYHPIKQDTDYYIIEDINNTHQIQSIKDTIKNNGIKNIILPMDWVKKNNIQDLKSWSINAILLDISNTTSPSSIYATIQKIKKTSIKQVGISIDALNKNAVWIFYQLLKQLTNEEKKSLIFRLKKHDTIPNNPNIGAVPLNAYYKWVVYTSLNMARKHGCHILINTNNLYDISWILIQRAQLHLQNKITFEGNLTQYPNIAKILFMVTQSTIQTKSILINSKNHQGNNLIIMNKLFTQNHIYQKYQSYPYPLSSLFKKTHKRFFHYLKKDYLKKYLNKFSIDE